MSEARVTDALARLERHRDLHLPLRRDDLLGRLALRFLWRRLVKWQVESNLATRDAVTAVRDLVGDLQRAQQDLATKAVDPDVVTTDRLNGELESVYRSDQNVMAGLNQRLYSAVGHVQAQVSDLRLRYAERAEDGDRLLERLTEVERAVAELAALARDDRVRQARLNLLLDSARPREVPDTARAADRESVIELARSALLDGSSEQVREARRTHLPVIERARAAGASGPVLDMSPGRGEWFEVLAAAGIQYRSATTNDLVLRHCADKGCDLVDGDPLDLLAETPHQSLGAVTSFRHAETLAPVDLARFVDLAVTAIAPGGVLVLESATAGRAGGSDFHLDPLALRPVHPDYLRFLAEAAGFARVEVLFPTPSGPSGWTSVEDPGAALETSDRYCLLAWR